MVGNRRRSLAVLATALFMLATAQAGNAYLFTSNGGESTLSAFAPAPTAR